MEDFFVFLYPLVAIISISAYLPQLKILICAKTPEDNISLSSWFLWMFSNIITFGYGFYHLQDFLFCLTIGTSLFLISLTICIILYNRHIRFNTLTEFVDHFSETISDASPETITETIAEGMAEIVPDVMLPETVSEYATAEEP